MKFLEDFMQYTKRVTVELPCDLVSEMENYKINYGASHTYQIKSGLELFLKIQKECFKKLEVTKGEQND